MFAVACMQLQDLANPDVHNSDWIHQLERLLACDAFNGMRNGIHELVFFI